MEKCSNCERKIGNLEAAHVYQDHTVCLDCYTKLTGRATPQTIEYAKGTTPTEGSAHEEEVVWQGRPSHYYYLKDYVIGFLLIPLLGFGVAIILNAYLNQKRTVYTLTNKRAYARTGYVTCRIHEVGTKDIRNINMFQGVGERLLGIGNVEIESAAAAGQGHVEFLGVKSPLSVCDLVRRTKDTADTSMQPSSAL